MSPDLHTNMTGTDVARFTHKYDRDWCRQIYTQIWPALMSPDLHTNMTGTDVARFTHKYDRDWCRQIYTQTVPVIFEPPCVYRYTAASNGLRSQRQTVRPRIRRHPPILGRRRKEKAQANDNCEETEPDTELCNNLKGLSLAWLSFVHSFLGMLMSAVCSQRSSDVAVSTSEQQFRVIWNILCGRDLHGPWWRHGLSSRRSTEENPRTVRSEAVRILAEALWGCLNAPNAAKLTCQPSFTCCD